MQQDTRADMSPAGTASHSPGVPSEPGHGEDEAGVTEELLVEEVSIDGMCGVY
jgi:mycofactocin precursor